MYSHFCYTTLKLDGLKCLWQKATTQDMCKGPSNIELLYCKKVTSYDEVQIFWKLLIFLTDVRTPNNLK